MSSNSKTKLDLSPSDEARGLGYTDGLFEKAVVSVGNTARLAKVMERAANGEKLNYVTFGGSITAGSGAAIHKNCYSNHVYRWWVEDFTRAEIKLYEYGYRRDGKRTRRSPRQERRS